MIKYLIMAYLTCTCFLMACQNAGKKEQHTIVVKESEICRKTLVVDGMACVGCEVTIEEKLSKIDGVVNVKASHKTKQVKVEFDSTKTDLSIIKSSIIESGYKLVE
jgi:copper chaperone